MTTALFAGERELARDLTRDEIYDLLEAGVDLDVPTTDEPDGPSGNDDADRVVDVLSIGEDADTHGDGGAGIDVDQPLDEAVGEWWDAGTFEDYSDTDPLDDARYDELQDALGEPSDIDHLRNLRDGRRSGGVDGERIRRDVQQSDLVDRLKAALRELTTRDRDEPAPSGHTLNIEAVVRHRAGAYHERDLYLHRDPAESGDRAVSVALDMSGSMNERRALVALAALAEATGVIGDDFMAVAYSTKWRGTGYTRLVTAPGEPFDYGHLDKVWSTGQTPTADGLRAATDLVLAADKPERLVVVITDGMANRQLQDGSTGDSKQDVRKMIHRARSHGVRVIGLGVDMSGSAARMRECFGEDWVSVRSANLVEALVEVYRRQLNVVGQ